MTDLQPILRSILESPWDDAPRYVYADALIEAGDPNRAEFIALQLRSPQLLTSYNEAAVSEASWPPAFTRLHDLLGACGREWLGGSDIEFIYRSAYAFRRGFVESIESGTTYFFRNAASMFAEFPITAVSLFSLRPVPTNGDVLILEAAGQSEVGLPEPIGNLLPRDRDEPDYAFFKSRDEMYRAVSSACVQYGRQQAGLTVLPEHAR